VRQRDEMIIEIVSRYLGEVTASRDAYLNDGQYHAQIDFMTRLMEIFDLAMRQQGLSAAMRFGVLERVMLSAPDPAEANRRIKMMKEMIINPDWAKKATCRW